MNRLKNIEIPKITRAEYERRIRRLKEKMRQQKVDVVVILYPTDILYYSGAGFLSIMIIPLDKNPILLVQINERRARKECWVDDLRPSRGLPTMQQVLVEEGLNKTTIGIELDVVPVNLFIRLQKMLPEARFVDISSALLEIRMIKSKTEIEIIRAIAEISEKGFLRCAEVLREGITELEVNEEMWEVQRTYGTESSMVARAWNQTMEFGIVASGPNSYEVSGYWMCESGMGLSLARPYGPSRRQIQKGEFICVNKGVMYKGYHIDEARTFIIGKPTLEQQKCYDAARKIQENAFAAVKPGVPVKEVYEVARKTAQEEGYGDYFMTKAFYDIPFLGHGLGLEIDEPPLVGPKTDLVLQPGMVMAFEPKIMIPGWGGVDIEDTLAVTENGAEFLTRTDRKLWVV